MTEFDRLLARLDSKLEEFKTEFKEGQEKVAAAAARKARQEPRYILSRFCSGGVVLDKAPCMSHLTSSLTWTSCLGVAGCRARLVTAGI